LYTWKKIQYSPDKTPDFERSGLVMRRLAEHDPAFLSYTVFVDKRKVEHLDQIKFYQKAFAQSRNAHIQLKDKVSELAPGELVLPSQPRFADSVRLYFPASKVVFDTPEGQLLELH